MEAASEHLAGGLTRWAVGHGVTLVAGTENERTLRRIYRAAAAEALEEVWDESAAPPDDESAEALAQHLLSFLDEPHVAERLWLDSVNGDRSGSAHLMDLVRRSGVDLRTPLPFELQDFLHALIGATHRHIDKELAKQGLGGVAGIRTGELLRRSESQGRGPNTRGGDTEEPARAQEALEALPLDEVPKPTGLPEKSVGGPGHYEHFVGRREELKSLARVLKGDAAFASRPVVAAVTGIGGVGKTQLASEFAHRYGRHFRGGVYWVNFSEPGGVAPEVASCGGAAGMALRNDFHRLPLSDQVAAVRAAWQSDVPRLLVFDGCEDPQLLSKWRPRTGGCRVLITSRKIHWEDPTLGVHTVPLEPMEDSDGVVLLRKHRSDVSAADPDLRAIARELDGLPLALDLAGRYLNVFGEEMTCGEYLEELRAAQRLAHDSLRDGEGISPTDHVMDVWATFNLSHKRLDPADAVDELALELLARMRHFAPAQPVPRDLVLSTTRRRPRKSRKATRALRRITDLGLLSYAGGPAELRTHQLVHDYLVDVIDDAEAQNAVEARLVDAAVYRYEHESPLRLQLLTPHLRAVAEGARDREDERAGYVFYAFGLALYESEKYEHAQPYWQRAFEIAKWHLGLADAITLQRLEHLGVLKKKQDDVDGAITIYEQVLDAHKTNPHYHAVLRHPRQASEKDVRNISSAFLNLGSALREKAMEIQDINLLRSVYPLYKTALELRQSRLGKDRDTAESLHNMGALLLDLLRHDADMPPPEQPEPYLRRSLHMFESVRGAQHHQLVGTLVLLASLKEDQGNSNEALSFWRRAFVVSKNTRGPEHQDTLHLEQEVKRLSGD